MTEQSKKLPASKAPAEVYDIKFGERVDRVNLSESYTDSGTLQQMLDLLEAGSKKDVLPSAAISSYVRPELLEALKTVTGHEGKKFRFEFEPKDWDDLVGKTSAPFEGEAWIVFTDHVPVIADPKEQVEALLDARCVMIRACLIRTPDEYLSVLMESFTADGSYKPLKFQFTRLCPCSARYVHTFVTTGVDDPEASGILHCPHKEGFDSDPVRGVYGAEYVTPDEEEDKDAKDKKPKQFKVWIITGTDEGLMAAATQVNQESKLDDLGEMVQAETDGDGEGLFDDLMSLQGGLGFGDPQESAKKMEAPDESEMDLLSPPDSEDAENTPHQARVIICYPK